ncbi:hypothetical protein FOMA001_g19119 [Fusarium oxysporum f. sp. matthiolae]|nr:hypothetical protein FOMA001_g19119 [Fusarium oxysporum f. sp. matthiolae]
MQLLLQNDIYRVQDDIDDTKALFDLSRAAQVSSGFRDWFEAPDATTGFNKAGRKKHPGTGLRFVKVPAFMTWLEKAASFLRLVGFAGCGKCVLCSPAIQFAFWQHRANPRIGIAFFFTFNEDNKQDESSMLQESPRDKHHGGILQCLAELRDWSEPGLHLIISRRDEVDIREELGALPEETIKMTNHSIDQGIASFISEHLCNNRRLRKSEEHHALIEAADLRQIWLSRCQFKALASCPQSEDLEQLLNFLLQSLDDTYDRMFSNIPWTSRDYARQMLTLLCCTKRTLAIAKLVDRIAVQLGDIPGYNPKRELQNIDSIQQVHRIGWDPNTSETTVRIVFFPFWNTWNPSG